jgi:hypothetical protein
MEGVKSLERSPEELPGVEGAERSEGDGGNWGGPPWPKRMRKTAEKPVSITEQREVRQVPRGRRRRS